MYMCNRFVLIICCIFIFFSFSCSNSQEVNITTDYAEQDTLKYFLTTEVEKLTWTEEIDATVISDKRKEDIERFGSPKYSTSVGAGLLPVTEEELVYPYIKNLGSLNMDDVDVNQLAFIQEFCESMLSSEKEIKDSFSFMASGREYMLTIFLYDMSELVFDSYIIASPVFNEDTAQFPVRFNTKNGYINLLLYVVPFNSNWCIDQIRYGEIVYE